MMPEMDGIEACEKIRQFPELQKFIITANHSSETDPELLRLEVSARHIIDSSTNTNYLSSYMRDWNNDSFFEFTVNADNSVNVNYRIRGENF